MSKSGSLPTALKTLLLQPTFSARLSRSGVQLPAGRSATPAPTPRIDELTAHLRSLSADASERGIGWAEWLSIATATIITLNSPGSLQTLHRVALSECTSSSSTSSVQDKVNRAALMREVGLKCIGFIGIPKVINNLAALRKAVEQDPDVVASLSTQPRRKFKPEQLSSVHQAAYALWDDIYSPHSSKLLGILGTSHPDLPVFIVEGEYGPLFAPPSSYTSSSPPVWEVNRLRTSLVAIAALRAQGGVGPQVTSHVWGLLKAQHSIQENQPDKNALMWLTSEQGALWTIRVIDSLCQAIEGAQQYEQPSKPKL